MKKAVLLTVTMLHLCTAAQPQKLKTEYRKNTFGPRAIPGIVAGAAFGHDGSFPRRLATGFTTLVVKNTITYSVAGIRHEDLHYYRSEKQGFGPRLEHALVSTVVTHKTTDGSRTVASGHIAGSIGSGMVASAMSTTGFSLAGGFASGGISLGATAGANVAREFWPRRKRTHRS